MHLLGNNVAYEHFICKEQLSRVKYTIKYITGNYHSINRITLAPSRLEQTTSHKRENKIYATTLAISEIHCALFKKCFFLWPSEKSINTLLGNLI